MPYKPTFTVVDARVLLSAPPAATAEQLAALSSRLLALAEAAGASLVRVAARSGGDSSAGVDVAIGGVDGHDLPELLTNLHAYTLTYWRGCGL